ncbi:helix-turn-helix domain-containing protein [Serinicoccus kebangsaanensis]|uniref:helix-turn-helix domain-containing protein n=1 Tax=Serinicoccus kebangsaanensis TaxID=2602069 RepID=UPI001EE2E340|nr:helix-turn-helix domain-containing protein [Serinicoccus kebangsaanensis]
MEDVRRLRHAAGVSQAELARRSGVAQPNIAAYEAGRRQPSAAMTERLRASLRPRPSQAVAAHRERILAVLAAHGMSRVKVFGSAAREADAPGSDLDLLVDFPPDGDLLDLIDGAEAVEELLGLHVDIVTSRSIGPDHEIARTAIPL